MEVNPAPESAEDARARMLSDRRGEVFAVLQAANHATGRVTRLVLRYSVSGRTDQFDLTVNGRPLTKPLGMVEIMRRWRSAITPNRGEACA